MKGIALTLSGGPPLALFSYAGFLFVPLGHGAVIQPSCAAVGGLLLAALVLREKLPVERAIGAAIIVAGLAVIGSEALATMGTQGVIGDLSFVTAGSLFAIFATLLRLWRIAPMRASGQAARTAAVGCMPEGVPIMRSRWGRPPRQAAEAGSRSAARSCDPT